MKRLMIAQAEDTRPLATASDTSTPTAPKQFSLVRHIVTLSWSQLFSRSREATLNSTTIPHINTVKNRFPIIENVGRTLIKVIIYLFLNV